MLAQFGEGERIEAEVFDEACRGRDARCAAGDLRERLRKPWLDLAADGRAFLGVTFEHPMQNRDDLGALYLTRAGARQFRVGEAQDADALVRVQARADFFEGGAELVLDGTAALAARVGGYGQRGDLFALRDFEADDGEFLDVLRMAVGLFEFVDVNVVAAGVDDDVLGAADDVERTVVVEASEVTRAEPSFADHLVGRGLVTVIAAHHVGSAREYFADARAVGRVEFYFDAREGLADRAQDQCIAGARDAQYRRRLGEPVTLEQLDADVVEKLRDALRQGRAAAYCQTKASAQGGMGLAEENRAEVQMIVAVETAVEVAQAVEGGLEERPARLDLIEDAAMDRLPQRGHADERRGTHASQRARETRGVDAERVDNPRAHRERQQHPASEFEGVMERQQREQDVVAIEREHPREHPDFRAEVAMREHHALGCAGGAGGEDDRRECLAIDNRRGR